MKLGRRSRLLGIAVTVGLVAQLLGASVSAAADLSTGSSPQPHPVPPIVSPPINLPPAVPPGSPAPAVTATTGSHAFGPTSPPTHAVTGFVPGQSQEIPTEGSERATVFQNPDGTRTARLYAHAIRWKDPATGAWRTFDDTIQTGRQALSAPGTPLSPSFGLKANDPALVQVHSGSDTASFSLEGTTAVTGTVSGTAVTYPAGAGGADLTYRVFDDRVKEEIVLKSPPSPGTSLSFRFPLILNGLTPSVESDGTIDFVDAQGTLRLFIPPGVVLDASGDKTVQSRVAVTLEGSPGASAVRITPDATWLADPARVYPVTVDPAWYYADGTKPLSDDAVVYSACGTCNYNGGGQTNDGWYFYDVAGRSTLTSPEYYTYLHYDLGAVSGPGKTIYSATWNANFFYATPDPANHFSLWHVVDPWYASSVTWNTRPNHDANRIDGTVPGPSYTGWESADLTTWVMNWSSGAWANNGISMDTAGDPYLFEFGAEENAYSAGDDSYIDVLYNSAPSVAQTSPGAGAGVHDGAPYPTPTLAASGSDPEGDPLQYDFLLASGSDAQSGTTVLQSGWQTGTSWIVPSGYLAWNQTYYWKVMVNDGYATTVSGVRSLTTPNAAPSVPATSLPVANAVLAQTSLSFGSTSATDPDGDPVTYQFQAATGPDGQTGRLAASQWLSSPAWSPAPGTFGDGGSYTWLVRAADNRGGVSAWSAVAPYKIDFGLGDRPSLPDDKVGPVSVNLSNGNLYASVAGPSLPTVGGSVGVAFSYNSQAPQLHGLTGDYYQDTNHNQAPDEPRLLERIDPQISFSWGSPGDGPAPGLIDPSWWVARWTGGIKGRRARTATGCSSPIPPTTRSRCASTGPWC